MPTVYTDALYSTTNLGIPGTVTGNGFFTLSAASNEVVLFSAGALAGQDVVGIAYNDADWAAGDALGARLDLTISPLIDGSASGDAPTTLSVGVSASGDLNFAVLLKNRQAVEVTYVGGTDTYTIDLSAATYDVSDKNTRRLQTLGFIA